MKLRIEARVMQFTKILIFLCPLGLQMGYTPMSIAIFVLNIEMMVLRLANWLEMTIVSIGLQGALVD